MPRSNMVQSLQRALDVLEQIARAENGLRLVEMAALLDLKPTTIFNLARTLQARGYLTRNGTQRYYLGPALDDIAVLRYRRDLFRRAEAGMLRLFAIYPAATVTFAELVGTDIYYRLRLSKELPGMPRRIFSQTFSPFGSASGLCLQAFNAVFRSAMAEPGVFEESAQRLWKRHRDFDGALDETARRGLAVIPGAAGWRLAAPITDTHTLGLSLDSEGFELDDIVMELKTMATSIAMPDERG